jgi:hypothetical protein
MSVFVFHTMAFASARGDQKAQMYFYDTSEKAEKAMAEWKQAHGLGCCSITEYPLNPATTDPPVVSLAEVQACRGQRM